MSCHKFSIWFLGVAISFAGGCAQHQLRNNTVLHAQTLSEIYRQQVLNNLAMFVYDPHALPSFAVANAGSSDIGNLGDVRVGVGALATGFDALGVNMRHQQTSKEAWTLSPVNDPQKLERMRSAYQAALASGNLLSQSGNCHVCERQGLTLSRSTASEERVNPIDGNATCCWFRRGCAKCLPEQDVSGYVGEYGDVRVWVPAGGRDELTRLILEILECALRDPPSAPRTPAVTVTEYLDASNNYTSFDKASKIIISDVRRESIFDSIPKEPTDPELAPLTVPAPPVLPAIPRAFPDKRRSDDPLQYLLRDELYRETLTPDRLGLRDRDIQESAVPLPASELEDIRSNAGKARLLPDNPTDDVDP